MNKHDLNKAYDKLSPTQEQKDRMLKNILKAKETQPTTEQRKKVIPIDFMRKSKFLSLAASFIFVFGIGVLIQKSLPFTSESPVDSAPITSPPSSESPMEPRKMFIYNNNSYVLLNDGEVFSLTQEDLGAPLVSDSSTFDHGITLYTLNSYDSAFRIALEQDGKYYIAQNVGPTDSTVFDVQSYYEAAQLATHIQKAEILDHRGTTLLRTLDLDEALLLLDAFASTKMTDLTPSQFEALANAQSEGHSYLVSFILKDGTTVTNYVIPSLNYVSIGDYTCTSPTLGTTISQYFKDLPQHPLTPKPLSSKNY